MKFHEFGDKNLPHIILIHGGGNSWWNYLRQARILSEEYHVILPTLDGHGEENQVDYVSTENSALEILDYIKKNCNGKLFAIGGVSLGGQIVMEILSQDSEIVEKAIIDGSICIPQPKLARISILLVSLFGKLMFSKFAFKNDSGFHRYVSNTIKEENKIRNFLIDMAPFSSSMKNESISDFRAIDLDLTQSVKEFSDTFSIKKGFCKTGVMIEGKVFMANYIPRARK